MCSGSVKTNCTFPASTNAQWENRSRCDAWRKIASGNRSVKKIPFSIAVLLAQFAFESHVFCVRVVERYVAKLFAHSPVKLIQGRGNSLHEFRGLHLLASSPNPS